jgi:hypothetical protein
MLTDPDHKKSQINSIDLFNVEKDFIDSNTVKSVILEYKNSLTEKVSEKLSRKRIFSQVDDNLNVDLYNLKRFKYLSISGDYDNKKDYIDFCKGEEMEVDN